MDNFTHIRVRENTKKIVQESKDLFISVFPEYENIKITDDKIVYEFFKNYNLILQRLQQDNKVVVFKK